jgi:hypothetical protein
VRLPKGEFLQLKVFGLQFIYNLPLSQKLLSKLLTLLAPPVGQGYDLTFGLLEQSAESVVLFLEPCVFTPQQFKLLPRVSLQLLLRAGQFALKPHAVFVQSVPVNRRFLDSLAHVLVQGAVSLKFNSLFLCYL